MTITRIITELECEEGTLVGEEVGKGESTEG
jgi:hypothetical protein